MRTLYWTRKLENIMKEMMRIKINVLGISEMRWTMQAELIPDSTLS